MEEKEDVVETAAVFDIFFLDAEGFECHLKLSGTRGVELLLAGKEAAARILELGGRPRKGRLAPANPKQAGRYRPPGSHWKV